MKKRGRGRPKYEPTEQHRTTVRALCAAGIQQEIICKCILKPDGKPIDPKTLRKYFAGEIETAVPLVTATAMSKLFGKIEMGNLGAICFWLKCRAGWIENQKLEVTGKDGAPIALPQTNSPVIISAIMQELAEVPMEARSRLAQRLLVLDGHGQ